MKKWLMGLTGLVLIFVMVLVIAFLNLGSVVKIAVNAYGPKITKTPIELGGAQVSVFKTEIYLENFVLGNPEGFSFPYAISIGSIFVDIDEDTLFQDILVIDRIQVIQSEIIYEIKGKTDNFRTIIENLKKPEKRGAPSEQGTTDVLPPEKSAGRKVIIRDLVFKDTTLRTGMAIDGGDITRTKISEIHLKNIGQKENGVEIARAAAMVLNDLYGQILSSEGLGGLKNRLKNLGEELGGVRQEIKSLGSHLKGLTDR